MIKNDLYYDLYDGDNGWGMGLGAKNQNDAYVCALVEILKEDDDEDEESEEKEEDKKEKKNNDNETKATDEILKKKYQLISQILNFSILLDLLLQCQFRSTHHRRIYPTLCTELFKPQERPQIKRNI